MRSALLTHNAKEQCELFAPDLLEEYGPRIDRCAKTIIAVQSNLYLADTVYDTSPSAYIAGAHIETAGNIAVYGDSEPVFKAVYTEGAWKIVPKGR